MPPVQQQSTTAIRVNGFEPPLANLQIATWVALPLLVLQFLFFVSPLLPLAASIPCTLIFISFSVASAYYGYKACIVNPMDRHLAQHLEENRAADEENGPKQNTKTMTMMTCLGGPPPDVPPPSDHPNNDSMKYCWVCETEVAELSMHCRYCNKCVDHFDHHCLWLNTCVGKANYTYFYKILWSIFGMHILHTFIMIGLVISIFLGGPTKQRAEDWFHADQAELVTGVLIFFIIVNVISLSAVTQLLLFHIGLQRKQMTTYEFIITANARKRQAVRDQEERQTQRTAAITRAQQDGDFWFLAIRLRMGQYSCCTPCDPLPKTKNESPTNGATTTTSSNNAKPDDDKNNKNNNKKNNNNKTSSSSAAVYAELTESRSEGATNGSSSIRDLVHSNAVSVGDSTSSSSSQHHGVTEKKQEEDRNVVVPEKDNTGGEDKDNEVVGETNVETCEEKVEEEEGVTDRESCPENV